MQLSIRSGRAKLRIFGSAALLIASFGVGGCYNHYGEGYAEFPEVFCGTLYACGNDSDTNRGNNQTAAGSTSNSTSNSSTSNTSSTGAGSAPPNGED